MLDLKSKLSLFLENQNIQYILIHSDLMRGFEIPFSNRTEFLQQHLVELKSLERQIWMPTFNYEFCGGKDYSVLNSSSQVGVLSEYFRKFGSDWRTEIPVFSFSGIGELPNLKREDIIDPFGNESGFHFLYENSGALMHYGSSFSSSTILHYVERISGNLLYRYNKEFKGKVITKDNIINDTVINYHVRPLNIYMEYDWSNLEKDLVEANILYEFKKGRTCILLCKIKDLVDFWIERMVFDPLYLLDNKSKELIKPILDKLGRPFLLNDFE